MRSTARSKSLRARLARVVTLLLASCAEPVLPPPPLLEDADPVLADMIDANDAIDGVAPRWSAFVGGEPVHYWHFGGRGVETMIAYRACALESGECRPIEHPLVVDRVPGEEGYSPYLALLDLRVPSGWMGRARSFDEVEQLIGSGIASAAPTSRYLHCPIAASDAELDVGAGATVRPARPIWVRGLEARCFDLSRDRERTTLPDGLMLVRNVYSLSREGESAALHEGRQMVDLTGDGDQLDTNQIFGVGLYDADYTPLWRVVRVTVPADYASIDTSMDETVAGYTSAADMFEIGPDYRLTPKDGRVIDFEVSDYLFDCPLQRVEGQL